MPDYEPYPLLDYREGVDQARKPWISPASTWEQLSNCHIARGRLEKRRGYSYLGQLGTKVTAEAIGASGATHYAGTLASFPLLPKEASPSTYKVAFTDGTLTLTDNGLGVLTGSGTGTISYATGAYVLDFSGATTAAVTAAYEYLRNSVASAQNGVLSITNFVQQSGLQTFLATDRRRAFKWNTTEKRFYDLEAADRWTQALLESFPWSTAYRDSLVIVNGVDTCFYYDAGTGTIKEVSTDWVGSKNTTDGGYARRIDSALMVFIYRGRAVFLRTKESGTTHHRRVRWTKVDPNFGDYASFRANDWADAPTNDRIVSAGFVRNDLIVWMEKSTWRLAPQDDPRLPFYWIKLAEGDGSLATRSTVESVDYCATVGPNAIVATDGQSVRTVSDKVPDAVRSWNQGKLNLSYGIRFDELRQQWFTYVARDEDVPKHVLAFQSDDEAFATYDLPFLSLGLWKQADSITWDGLDVFGDLDDVSISLDATETQSGFPVLMGGGIDQKLYYASYGHSDAGALYFLRARSQRLNPYSGAGVAARLGFIDIVAQRSDQAILVVRCYADFSDVPYLVKSINLESQSGEQLRKRVLVNRVAQFHQVEIIDLSGAAVALDGLILWMKPEARARGLKS